MKLDMTLDYESRAGFKFKAPDSQSSAAPVDHSSAESLCAQHGQMQVCHATCVAGLVCRSRQRQGKKCCTSGSVTERIMIQVTASRAKTEHACGVQTLSVSQAETLKESDPKHNL